MGQLLRTGVANKEAQQRGGRVVLSTLQHQEITSIVSTNRLYLPYNVIGGGRTILRKH